MREHNLHQRLKAAPLVSQSLFGIERNLFELHGRAGVSSKTQALELPLDLEALGALGDQVEVNVQGARSVHLSRRDYVALRLTCAGDEGLPGAQRGPLAVPANLADGGVEVRARARLAKGECGQVLSSGDNRSEERRVGKGVDLGGRRIIKKKKKR